MFNSFREELLELNPGMLSYEIDRCLTYGRNAIYLNSIQGSQKITALASATVVFIECMSMAFAYEYDHDLKVK